MKECVVWCVGMCDEGLGSAAAFIYRPTLMLQGVLRLQISVSLRTDVMFIKALSVCVSEGDSLMWNCPLKRNQERIGHGYQVD